jgi:hypothetical protein
MPPRTRSGPPIHDGSGNRYWYSKGCPCESCLLFVRTEARDRYRRTHRPDSDWIAPHGLVPAKEARAYILALCSRGATYQQIADACGMSKRGVYMIVNHYKNIKRSTEKKILNTIPPQVERSPHKLVSATSAQEHMVELKKHFTYVQIAKMSGVHKDNLLRILKGRRTEISLKTRDRILEVEIPDAT